VEQALGNGKASEGVDERELQKVKTNLRRTTTADLRAGFS
jgi:hypothetical protein